MASSPQYLDTFDRKTSSKWPPTLLTGIYSQHGTDPFHSSMEYPPTQFSPVLPPLLPSSVQMETYPWTGNKSSQPNNFYVNDQAQIHQQHIHNRNSFEIRKPILGRSPLKETRFNAHNPSTFEGGQIIGMPRPQPVTLLPRPSAILPSQETSEQCLACGRADCTLSSHRHFSKSAADNAKTRDQSKMMSSGSTRRISAVPVSATTPRSGRPRSTAQVRPLGLDPDGEQLLQLWYSSWSPQSSIPSPGLPPERHLFPRPFIDRVLPFAQDYPPLLHALLAYSGILASLANGDQRIAVLGAHQQTYAVDLLSQACPGEGEASSDAAMLTATLLMLVYMAQGNAVEVQKHISGLSYLCRIRGGLHYLGMGGLVSECLLWADGMTGIWLNVNPMWEMILPPIDIDVKGPKRYGSALTKAVAIHEGKLVASSQEEQSSALLGLTLDVIQAFRGLCRLTDIFAAAAGRSMDQLPRAAINGYGYIAGVVEFQLARCNAIYQGSGTIDECVILALFLFNHAILRNDGLITTLLMQVEYRFWTILSTPLRREIIQKTVAGLRLWLCFTGLSVGVLLRRRGEDTQFWSVAIRNLNEVNQRLGCSTWEEVKREVLEEYVWLAGAQEDLYRRAWLDATGINTR